MALIYKFVCDGCGETTEKEYQGTPEGWERLLVNLSSRNHPRPDVSIYEGFSICCGRCVRILKRVVAFKGEWPGIAKAEEVGSRENEICRIASIVDRYVYAHEGWAYGGQELPPEMRDVSSTTELSVFIARAILKELAGPHDSVDEQN